MSTKITLDPKIQAKVESIMKEAEECQERLEFLHTALWEAVDEDPQCDTDNELYRIDRETHDLYHEGPMPKDDLEDMVTAFLKKHAS